MRDSLRVVQIAALGMLMLTSPGVVSATDQLILGKKLLIKNPPSGTTHNKLVHLGKDAGITVGLPGGSGDPQCGGLGGGGGTLRVVASGGAGDVTIPLPCAFWTTNGSNTLYKYRDATGGTCKLVLVKNGVLVKAVCGGTQVGIDVDAGMSPVAIVTTLNAQQYCTAFGGTVVKDGADQKTFLGKNAPAPSSCPTTTTTLPSATCCNSPSSATCFDIDSQSDADFCGSTGGTGSSGVCDGATGTCQPAYGGESECCTGAPGIPCVEGPDIDEILCLNYGGIYAHDSCANGCLPSTSTTSTTSTSTTSTSSTSTSSTSSSSTSTSTSSTTTSTAFPPCTTLGALCGGPACVSVCQMTHCGSAGCTLACMDDDVTPGSCSTDADCPSPFLCTGCSAGTCSTSGGFCRLTHEDRSPGCP